MLATGATPYFSVLARAYVGHFEFLLGLFSPFRRCNSPVTDQPAPPFPPPWFRTCPSSCSSSLLFVVLIDRVLSNPVFSCCR